MCVIAGYSGTREAAPVLLEMLEREQGLAGGYYTGIATVHEGKLYHAKVVGDVATLRRKTDAERLPGCIGIAHSRTPSGGDREWSHPFVDCTGRLAYVANGARGIFAERVDLTAGGNALLDAGHQFHAVSNEPVGNYPPLRDGRWVHLSDVMCHAVEAAYARVGTLRDALAQAYQSLPGEIVGLALHADAPDHFAAARFNYPLVIGRDTNGVYAASTAIAFPQSVIWRMAMPANAAATVARDRVDVLPFAIEAMPVAPMPSPLAAQAALIPALREQGAMAIGQLCEVTTPLWPKGQLEPRAMLVFETVAALLAEGRVRLETERVPGMFGIGTVPRTRVRWIG